MLVETLIAQICAGLIGQPQAACSSAFRAACIQTQITPTIDLAERKTNEMVYHTVVHYTGDEILGVAGFTAKVVRDKSLTYPIRRHSRGLIPSITPTVGVLGGSVSFNWRF